MPDLPVVSVIGTAAQEVQPELATLSVQLRAEDKERAAALRRINDRGTTLDTVVKGFRDAVERVETEVVRVTPVFKGDRPRERVSGYTATLVKRLTVIDFSRLGEMLAQVADLELATVTGPWWDLRPDSAARRQARLAAVRDAVRQAHDYAAAVGSQLAELVELADTGLLGRHQASPRFSYSAASPQAMAAPDEMTFDLEPQLQTVEATIEARFRITVPDLSAVPSD